MDLVAVAADCATCGDAVTFRRPADIERQLDVWWRAHYNPALLEVHVDGGDGPVVWRRRD